MWGHPCCLCGRPDVPVFRFACPRCFTSLPPLMRREGVRAYKYRIAEPVAYQETLAAILLWRRDQMAIRIDPPKERTE